MIFTPFKLISISFDSSLFSPIDKDHILGMVVKFLCFFQEEYQDSLYCKCTSLIVF